ncbi:MAG TPA: ABC transporter substrate binding protein [Deltaproteobacteria bacterium]|nr:ABC transporter substrate binding protein [Deltaproteobacteria bacterium]HPJ95309.1 ABC transporter substrate binding protein [Deltaproteobacteria bacterium]HPR52896.1 ABC transporter substrate binding protein [Deltaproteobacteria bacterium]
MKRRQQWIVTLLTGMFLVLLAQTSSLYAARIFILHSYEKDHVCGQPQHDGVVSALRQAGYHEGENLELQVYFMDTKQRNNTPELIKREASIARNMIDAFKPDVLVTLDDNAFSSVGLAYADASFPVVFCGVNNLLENYNARVPFMNSREAPGHNITGVYEKLHVSDALRVHSSLFPGVRKVQFIVDTSVTGRAIFEQIKQEIAVDPPPCAWGLTVVDSWEAYQEEIHRVNRDSTVSALYPAALLLKDKDGKSYTAKQIISWTTRVSTKPELAVNYMFSRLGLFGGATVDFFAMGKQSGVMVVKILQGENPAGIAIDDAGRYALAFNLRRANELGIDIPKDVILSADEVYTD